MDAQSFHLRPLLKPAHPPFQFTAKPIYLTFNQFSKRAAFNAYNSHYKKNSNLFVRRKSWSNHKLVVSCESNAENGVGGSSISDEAIRRKNLAVFVSGGGSNFKSIHKAILEGRIHGDIVALVASKNDCGGAVYARDEGIPIILFPKTKSGKDGLSSNDLVTTLRKLNVDYILLAGFLKLIPAELIRSYPRSILNIHPSLLPAFGGKGFYGMKVHEAVIASGARYSGPTIHFVDEHYDTGRILAQQIVPVLASDTANDLATRVLHEEHKLYVEVTTMLCKERIVWREDGVPLIQSQDGHLY